MVWGVGSCPMRSCVEYLRKAERSMSYTSRSNEYHCPFCKCGHFVNFLGKYCHFVNILGTVFPCKNGVEARLPV